MRKNYINPELVLKALYTCFECFDIQNYEMLSNNVSFEQLYLRIIPTRCLSDNLLSN